MNFPGTIRVRVIHPHLPDSVVSCVMRKKTPALTVAHLNKLAAEHGTEATYQLATEEEYWAYRKNLQESISAAKS